MSPMTRTAGNELRLVGSPREVISLIANLWDIECRHQLGEISRADYLRAVMAVRSGFDNGDMTVEPMGMIDAR